MQVPVAGVMFVPPIKQCDQSRLDHILQYESFKSMWGDFLWKVVWQLILYDRCLLNPKIYVARRYSYYLPPKIQNGRLICNKLTALQNLHVYVGHCIFFHVLYASHYVCGSFVMSLSVYGIYMVTMASKMADKLIANKSKWRNLWICRFNNVI